MFTFNKLHVVTYNSTKVSPQKTYYMAQYNPMLVRLQRKIEEQKKKKSWKSLVVSKEKCTFAADNQNSIT